MSIIFNIISVVLILFHLRSCLPFNCDSRVKCDMFIYIVAVVTVYVIVSVKVYFV